MFHKNKNASPVFPTRSTGQNYGTPEKGSINKTQISSVTTKSDPSEVKERLVMRLIFKMKKQFGEDSNTTDTITKVIKEKIKLNKLLKPNDIDDIE